MNWLRELIFLAAISAAALFAFIAIGLTFDHVRMVKEINRVKTTCFYLNPDGH